MSSILQISRSALLGFGIYRSYYHSRVFQAGWEEQKGFCTLDNIGNLVLLTIAAQDNVTTLWGRSLAGRISRLSYASYILVPTLHHLSNRLAASPLRDLIDFTYLHLPDLLLMGTAVHTVAALRFGYNRVGNGMQLAFILLSILEQGPFWMDPKQNQGPLAKQLDGKLYHFYQPYMMRLSYYLNIPFQFLFKGVVGKAFALMTLFLRYAPSDYKGALIPDEVKERFQELLEEARAGEIKLLQGEESLGMWLLNDLSFQSYFQDLMLKATTQKSLGVSDFQIQQNLVEDFGAIIRKRFDLTRHHLEPLTIEDFFPDRTLAELEVQLQERLENDLSLTLEERSVLEGLIGTEGGIGQLRNVVIHSDYEVLRRERNAIFKGVFGAICQNWEKGKQMLLSRQEEFLCDVAVADEMKKLYLEYYPSLKYPNNNQAQNKRALGMRLKMAISLIFQQYRSHFFAAGIQEASAKLRKEVTEGAERKAEERLNRLYEEIQDWSQISTTLWWKNLAKYCFKGVQSMLWQNLNHVLHHMGTNRHEVNFHMALYGKELGLIGYEEARKDMEKLLQQFSLNIDLLDELSSHLGELFKIQVMRLHDEVWYGNLLECILNPGDERLRSEHVLTYIRYRAEDFPSIKDQVQDEIDTYFENPDEDVLKVLTANYFPQVLFDLNFLDKKEAPFLEQAWS